MREIKFRAWDGVRVRDVRTIDFDSHGRAERIEFSCGDAEGVEEFKLIEFTGLKDKNGVEIYEGDIVKKEIENFVIPNKDIIGKVEFNLASFFFLEIDTSKPLVDYHTLDSECKDYLGNDRGVDYEVIGNIYENPELLKEQHE